MSAISPSPAESVPPSSLSQPSSQLAPIQQPTANPPNPNSSLAQSPVPNNPPSSNSSNPTPDSSPPPPVVVDSPPPPIPSTSTPIVALPPPINATPPQSPPPEASPPPLLPVSSPAPLSTPIPPPTPPTSSPSPPPPTPSSPPPNVRSPTPPSSNPQSPPPPSPNPPINTPPSSNPPPPPPTLPNTRPSSNSPPPPTTLPNPPTNSPSSTRPPHNSPPPPPSSEPPRASQSLPPPASSGRPRGSPPSGSHSAPPPAVLQQPPAPVSRVSPSPPSPGSQTTVTSPPSHSPPSNVPQGTNNGARSNGGIGSGGVVGIGVVVGILLLGFIGLVAFCMFKRKKRNSRANGGLVIPASGGSSPGSDAKLFIKTEYPASLFGGSSSDTPTERGGFGHSRSLFTYQDLFEATNEFSDENLLGEGGFGFVYKGILQDGRLVAVKQLKIGASQGEREFKAEVEIIGRIHHRHLVSLVGYCVSDSKRLLVYEYVPNNTLHFHLHGQGMTDLDWEKRIKIAAGAARGIAYLHEDCQPRIIHRDIKSSNILLDNNFVARVSDFGLAKLAMDADTHVSTRVMGTFGYMAPEYATSGKLTEKSDVYSFGVVLLELITGRKPVDVSQPLGDEGLVEWARPLLSHALDTGELAGLVDSRLENNYIESQIFLMIEAAAACVRHSATKRPRMGQVVRAFDGISDSGDLSNGLRVGESQLYDSAQQSAEIKWFRRMAFGSQGISTDFFTQPTQSEHNGNLSARQGQSGNFSRHPSQDAPNLSFSRQSGRNLNFSDQQGRTGQRSSFSRLPSQDNQDLGFSGQSGQNVNFSARHGQSGNFTRQQRVDAQNPSFTGPSRQNVYSSAQHDFDDDISR